MYKVASQAGVIHSQNHGFHARSRPAGDAQQLSSPFSGLLDDANAAPPLSPKEVCERPQATQTSRAPGPGDTQGQQRPTDSEPTPQPAVAAPAQPVDEGEKIDKTAAEATALASVDDKTDPAKAPGDAAVTMVIALTDATQPTPEQQVPAVVIAPVMPFETQPLPEQAAAPSVPAPALPSEPKAAAAESVPAAVTTPAAPPETQPVSGQAAPVVAAPAAPLETQPASGQAAPVVAAPAAPLETQPASGPAVPISTAPVGSLGQSAPQQPIAAVAATASETQSAREQPGSAPADAIAVPAQTQLTLAGTAGVQPASIDDPAATGAAGPQPVSPAKLAADQESMTLPANPNGSQIGRPQTDGSKTAEAVQNSNPAPTTSDAPATNAGPAANEEHRDGHADTAPDGKKEHAAVRAASRAAPQIPEPSSAPHAAAHAGDIAQAGKSPDGVQLVTMPQPADRFATVAAQAAQSASAHDAAAAAVPLAGLAVEIAARAQAGRNRFEIRLDPPELGRVDVRLDIDRNGQVTSRLTVERVETLDALRRDAGDLERALQQAGFKTADNGLQFTLRDQSFAGRDQSLPTTAAARVVVPDPELAANDTMPAGYGRILRPGGGIDIRV